MRLFDRYVDFLTAHNRLIVFLMLVLTAGIAAGTAGLQTDSGAGEDSMFPSTTPDQKADYVDRHYGNETGGDNRTHAVVYVRQRDSNALSKRVLIDSLTYQQSVLDDPAMANATTEARTVQAIPNMVGKRLAGDRNASLDAQLAALRDADESRVRATIEETLTANDSALALLPTDFEPGTATAKSHRMVFTLTATDGEAPSDATHVLFEAARDRDQPAFFTLGDHAMDAANETLTRNTFEFTIPIALALIVSVLAFTYRDLVDVLVGMVGVVVSIVWMFGILGWLRISAGITMIVGPILIAGLSIDYGFHVFMRYREHRHSRPEAGDSGKPAVGIRAAMGGAVRSIGFALALVTATAGIGFLSNVVNPMDSIRALGIGITLGVVSAFVIFVSLVPALKITVDSVLERAGLDRRKRPLGSGRVLAPLLRSSVSLARRAAPIVIVLALVAGAGGAVAWTTLEEKPFDRQTEPAADWKTQLPGPMAWEDAEYSLDQLYVREHYRAVADDGTDRFQILVEGDVTDDEALERVHAGIAEIDATASAPPAADVVSPLSVLRSAAASDDVLATALDRTDTDGNGVPDTDIASLYDRLYEIAPQLAERVIERSGGEYESLRIVGPAEGKGSLGERADRQRSVAAAVQDDSLTATAISRSTIRQSGIETVTDGVVLVMVLALFAVALTYVAVSRHVHGSATLGVATVVPIALVTGLVVSGMALLAVPLTLLTALLMSLVIGLGVDYNIHLSDRFIQELAREKTVFEALETAVVGTGGALLGSALTTSLAFASIALHPSPQLQNFGTLVVLAMTSSLVVSVVVLPSILTVWGRYVYSGAAATDPDPAGVPADD